MSIVLHRIIRGARRRGVIVSSRVPYEETRALVRALKASGVPALLVFENPSLRLPEVVRQLVVRAAGLGEASIASLVASVLGWAVVLRRALQRSPTRYVVTIETRGDQSLKILIAPGKVRIVGDLTCDPPPGQRTARPQRRRRRKETATPKKRPGVSGGRRRRKE